MTTIDPSAPILSLTATIEERILAPLRRDAFAARTWFLVTLAAILCLHGAILALLLTRDRDASRDAAKQETPIEVVIEQPKDVPKPPPKAPDTPKPQAKQEIEKPASSAPRAPNEEKVDTAATQKETRAPKAPTPPTDGKPEPSKEASSPAQETAQDDRTKEAEAKPDILQKDAEALEKAVPQPRPRPKALAKLTPRAKTRRATTALQQLAGASSLPDYSFARPTRKSPVYGGTEDSRYLAIVYGMIMQHRSRVGVPGGAGGNVTLAFNVDDEGNVIGIGIEHTSGYPEIDLEAAAAIRRASPFPPPPPGAPHGLVATIDFGESAPVYTMGSRSR